jgi:iron complex outermembrane receptor protein
MSSMSPGVLSWNKTRQVVAHLLIALVIGGAITSASRSFAESAATGAPSTDSDGVPEQGQLDEILVVAERRQERLVDVPIAISTVSGVKLQRDGITDLLDVAQEVPGLRFDAAGANVEPTIRGVGTLLTGPGLKPNVPVYVDGFYVPSELATNFQLLSVSDISVLKGPQGTLFGRNATGGAVLVRTLDPTFDPTLTAVASEGSYEKRDVNLYGSTRLTDSVAMNVAGFWQRGNGYVTNINTGSTDDGAFKNWEVRTKLLYKPMDALNILVAYDHGDVNDPTLIDWSNYNGLTAGNVIPGVKVATGPWDTSQGFVSSNRELVNSESITAHLDLSFATLSSYSQYREDKAYQNFDSDVTSAPIFTSFYFIYDDTFTQEINLTSNQGSKLAWVTGLYFYRNDNVYNPYDSARNGHPETETFDTNNLSQSYAAYADGTYEIADHLFFTAGLRYTYDKVFEYFNLIHVKMRNAEDDFRNWSPRAVLRYQLNDQSNVYLSYTQGYKAGALPAASFSTVPLQPETIDAYEIGYKFSDQTFQFETSAYYYDYKNLQVSAFTGFSSIDTNAAKSTIYGADASFKAQLTRELRLDLGVAYTHAVYDNYRDASGYVQNLNPASPTYGYFNSSTVGSSGALFNATGNTLPRAPRFTSTVGLDYTHRFANGFIDLTAIDYFTTKVYFDPVNQFSQDAYSVLNLRATWSAPDSRWAVSLYATNVTNSAYRDQVLPGSFAIKQTYGAPAQYGGSVTLHF